MTKPPYRTLLLLLLVLFAIILPFCLFGEAITDWTNHLLAQAESHRLTTGLLLALLLASDILLPVPSSLASTACGMALGFIGGATASFIGMTLSSTAGYVLGRYASAVAFRLIGPNEGAMLKDFHARQGIWLLLALRPVPVLAEASVLFSGVTRQPFLQTLAITSLGNAAVSLAYAAVGAWGRISDSFLPAFGVSMLVSGVFFVRLHRARVTSAARPAE